MVFLNEDARRRKRSSRTWLVVTQTSNTDQKYRARHAFPKKTDDKQRETKYCPNYLVVDDGCNDDV